MPYKKANIILAFLYMIFSKQRYAAMSLDHGMWINLKAEDLKRAYDNGTFPKEGWREEETPNVLKSLGQLKHAFWKSLFITLIIVAAVLGCGFYIGTLGLKFNLDYIKAISFTGGCIAAWGAIFQLVCPDIETFCKQSLNEIMQKSIFFILFIVGIFISLSSLVL